MENEREIVRFTEEEIVFVREVAEVNLKVYQEMRENMIKQFNSIRRSGGEAEYYKHKEFIDDVLLMLDAVKEEPDLVFQTNNETKLIMIQEFVQVKKLVGFKRQMAIEIRRKLEKELDNVVKMKYPWLE